MTVQLLTNIWPEFENYLLVEAKYSRKSEARFATKSRFFGIARFFEERHLDWTRENFRAFITYTLERPKRNDPKEKCSEAYCNKFIGLAKQLDRFLGTKILQDFSYYTEEQNIDYDVLTPEEIEMLANVNIQYGKGGHYLNRRNKVMILIQGLIGARPGELCNLKWVDTRFNGKTWIIYFKNTKTKRQRKCVIGIKLGELLQDLPKWSEYVFTSYRGKQLRVHEYNAEIKRRKEACGLQKKIWAYLLRHSGITTMVQRGIEGYTVSGIVGHSDPRTTMRYIHNDEDHLYNEMSVHPFLAPERNKEMDRKIALDVLQKYYPNRKTDVHMDSEGNISIEIKRQNKVK